MRILFIGGGRWGCAALKAAVGSGARVAAVDSPSLDGRYKFRGGFFLRRLLHRSKILQRTYSIFSNGENLFYEAIWQFRIPVIVTGSINERGFLRKARHFKPDLILVASCSEILGKEIISLPAYGCINCHPSLLPKYRGPDPFFWVLKNKERETGVTLHFINERIDAGDILLQKRIGLRPEETEESLVLRSAALISDMVTEILGSLKEGKLNTQRQDAAEATYYPSLVRSLPGRLRIRDFSASESGLWEKLIKGSRQYNFFSTFFWLSAVSEATGERYKMTACFYDGRPLCGYAALLRSTLEGKLITGAPLSQYSTILFFPQEPATENPGVLQAGDERRESLLALSGYIRSNSDWSILYMHPDFEGASLLEDDGWKLEQRYTYYLDLADLDKLYSGFDNSLKRRIDKRTRETFCFNDRFEEFSVFYSLWANTFIRQRLKPPLRRTEFKAVYNKITEKGFCKTISAYDNKGALASAVVFITDGDTAYYWASALNREYASMGVNQRALWEGLKILSESGVKNFDFVGADTPSIAAYKKHFGGRLVCHARASCVSSGRAKAVRGVKNLYRGFSPHRYD